MIIGANSRGEVAAFSGKGNVREHNEDRVGIDGKLIDSERIIQEVLPSYPDHLIVVADGMGGHVSGEVASKITVHAIGKFWQSSRSRFEPFEAIRVGNQAIYAEMEADSSLRGMGSTVVGAHIQATKMVWFNLGDSRGYLFRDGRLVQFTMDHVPSGTSAGGRRTHAITQSLGGRRSRAGVWPASGALDFRREDVFLFCSDGLTDIVSDEVIAQLLRVSTSLVDGVTRLFQAAERGGAPDNVSIVLFAP